MKTFLVRGVPASLQHDSWWMDGLIQRRPPVATGTSPVTDQRRMERPLLLIALIALADALLWGANPGVSLVVFGATLLIAGVVMRGGRGWGGLVLAGVLFLPLVEQVQLLSVLFWLAGLLAGGAWIAFGGWTGVRDVSLGAMRLLGYGPLCAISDAVSVLTTSRSPRRFQEKLGQFTLGWAVPLGLGLMFVALLIEANPVVEQWMGHARDLRLPDMSRVFFWAGIGVLIWPFLKLGSLRQRLTPSARTAFIGPLWRPAVLNPDAVRRSLILFNAIFAVQTVMDATYLWGGAALPDGMSYAEYAHRGAYPLLVTALLAGAFAILARPFTDMDRMLRMVLVLWLGQTILLVISSILRLELYVEVYGLTRLRLAAGIWMMVVAAGLGLTLWQVLRRHTTGWLMGRGVLMGLATVYLSLFLSFDRAIARYNLTHDVPQDPYYLCALGSAALPEIRQHAPGLCDIYYGPRAPILTDWREWGFRDWRVLRSLRVMSTVQAPL